MNKDFKYNSTETEGEYLQRLYTLKEQSNLTWADIRDIANEELGYDYSSDKYRKDAYRYLKGYTVENCNSDIDLDEQILEMRVERTKLADERNNLNAVYRRIAREDSIKDIAREAATIIGNNIKLPESKNVKINTGYEGILLVSDWHYGLTIDNIFNKYNPDIAKERIKKLQEETIRKCKERNISNLTVINLGDLIAGNIHLPLRINSRIDVITQILEVSELYAEFLANLAKYFNISTYSVLDNHSRIDPNKDTSLQLESLARITPWYLKERLKNCNVKIVDNIIDDNITTFKVMNYDIIGVHGDLDKQAKIVERLSSFTQEHYDLIVSAHMHHFSANESNNTVVICNGSLMGTDDYAFKLRLNSQPSQTLIIVSDNSPCEEIHRITLN